MIRRTVAPIGPLVLALLAAPLAAEAQPAATVPQMGLLDISSLAARASLWEAFRYLADRIVVLTSHPGTVRAELPISLPRMRDPLRVEFLDHQREVIAHLTASPARR